MDPLNKRDVANYLLEKGSIFVHLDPRFESVQCPPEFKFQAQLVLELALNLPIPIPDLRIDDQGIFGTLSFKGSPFACYCPWHSIFAIVGNEGRGQIWAGSMPPEVAAEAVPPQREAAGAAPPPTPRKTRSGKPLPAGWRIIK